MQPIAQGGILLSDITIYTLAKELNMTPSMVSRAFNPNGKISEDKRKIVLDTAKKYGFSPNRFASRLSMKTVHIGILISSGFNVNTERMIKGIETAYENLKDYKVKYDITVLNPEQSNFKDYKNVLSGYKNSDGVILTGMSASKYTDMINDFYKQNENIVQVQAINSDADYLFASKHNEETASSLSAEFLYNCLRKSSRKNILLFTGNKESALHKNAEKSFCDTCKKMGMNVLECIDMKDNQEYFKKLLPEVFEKYAKDTDGIYITSGFSTPLSEFLEQTGLDIPYVAFDAYKDTKTYMEKGIISAIISQNVSKQMETAFQSLVEHIITGTECDKTIYTDVQLVLKSNMHQF